MKSKQLLSGLALFNFLLLSSAFAADPFAEIIRKSEPLSPQEEQKQFHLPPGFEIQLVASEPNIGKPMNLAFDAKGRLWLTQSREYPFPVLPVEKSGRDKIQILSDFDSSGRAKKITTFADGFNIPIGIYPYKNAALAFSIPNIWSLQDTNGDGRADTKELVLGRFGYEKDTHGLTSAFRRGYDGWIYADHGFNNDSTLIAKDGSTIKLNSGNCYRFKPDGSRVEQYSWGQVNPFGLMFDPLGDLWSADCHSSPVYQLLRGAYYPSFGKPNDGLGYAPNICTHQHGSTAIAGMVYYAATNFPSQYQGNTFVGNVMTCRINRDSYIEHGSTRIAKEEPDFLTGDDPWFRPVDIQLGPDGAIYVADFYDRIIGHYEVPLDNPGRDRERGRIWRIVYTGNNSRDSKEPLALPNDVKGLITELGNPNITRRMLAMNKLVDEIGKPAVDPVKKIFRDKKTSVFQKVHGLWILQRLDALDEKILTAAAKDSDNLVRVHVMRVLSETENWTPVQHNMAAQGLQDSFAYTRRAAADALGRHPSVENIRPLLDLRDKIPSEDSQLLHTVRMALRNQLIPEQNFRLIQNGELTEADARAIADVALGVKTPESGKFLLAHVQKYSQEREKLVESLKHAARFAPDSEMSTLANFTRTKFADDLDFQLTLFKSVQEGTSQRGSALNTNLYDWGAELAEHLLASIDEKSLEWRNSSVKGDDSANPWFLETRTSADGDKLSQFISSLSPAGEKLTGVLRSKNFTVPEKITFYMAGHNGSPEKPAHKRNIIRIRDAETKKILAENFPPRNDIAQKFTWDLSKHAGKQGYIEVTDGDKGSGFAWLAVGRFEPQIVPLPKIFPSNVDKRQKSAAELAADLKLTRLEPQLAALLVDKKANDQSRTAAAKALQTLSPDTHLAEFENIFKDNEAPLKLREKVAALFGEMNSEKTRSTLIENLNPSPKTLQTQIALALAGSTNGAETLLQNVADGKISARWLQDRAVKDRLVGLKSTNITERVEALTKNLSPVSAEKQKLIDERIAAFNSTETSATRGAEVFKANCVVCHSIGGEGGLVGPQLDGVGLRGAERLVEDILDPSRNVDPAFRYIIVTRTDDEVVTGLQRREEGETLVLVDATGKEISIPKKEIKERRQSELSLMPDNFSEAISKDDLNSLLAFLLSKNARTATIK